MSASDLVGVVTGLEKQVQDMMLILATIAYMQEDGVFTVSLTELGKLPKGSSVDFSFNKKTQEYEFMFVPPAEAKGPSLVLPASVHPDTVKSLQNPSLPLKGEINL